MCCKGMRIENQRYRDAKSSLEGNKVVGSVFTKINVGRKDFRIKLIL